MACVITGSYDCSCHMLTGLRGLGALGLRIWGFRGSSIFKSLPREPDGYPTLGPTRDAPAPSVRLRVGGWPTTPV